MKLSNDFALKDARELLLSKKVIDNRLLFLKKDYDNASLEDYFFVGVKLCIEE